MTFDTVSEIAFGAPIGFTDKGADVDGLIKGFHQTLPLVGALPRVYPLIELVNKTPLRKYLQANPEDNSGFGLLMRFRDKLLADRLEAIKIGSTGGRIDLLQACAMMPPAIVICIFINPPW